MIAYSKYYENYLPYLLVTTGDREVLVILVQAIGEVIRLVLASTFILSKRCSEDNADFVKMFILLVSLAYLLVARKLAGYMPGLTMLLVHKVFLLHGLHGL